MRSVIAQPRRVPVCYGSFAQPARAGHLGGVENKTVLGAAALAVFATAASAQDRRPDYGTAVNAAVAKKIAADVLAECQKNSWNVAVAVVDNHGFLIYFERMDNTQIAGVDIAVGKARTAATYRRSTRVFVDASTRAGRPRPPCPA